MRRLFPPDPSRRPPMPAPLLARSRTPRRIQGEAGIKLPQDVAIDLDKNFAYGTPLPIDPSTGNIDLLFAPGGGLTGRGLANDRINLWVRDVTLDVTNPNNVNPNTGR